MVDEDGVIDRDDMADVMKYMMQGIANMVDEPITLAKEYDVSNILSDDVKAKIQLIAGDFVIIPIDKLREYADKIKE